MQRLRISTHDLVTLGLITAPMAVACICALAHLDATWLVSLSGLTALVCIWIYLAFIVTRRSRWIAELEDVSQSLWRAADQRPIVGDDLSPPARVTQSLRDVRGPVVAKLESAVSDLANMRAVYDAMQSPVLATNAAGTVVAANAAARVYFSESGKPADVVNRNVEDLFTQAQIMGQHTAALAGATRTGEIRVTRDGFLRVYQVFTAPIELRDGSTTPATSRTAPSKGVVITLRDVTELAQAIYLKTDFVANASHELRTPLSSIRAATETLADGAWEDAPMRDRLTQVIAGNVQRLEEMVRDLLDLSRLDSPDAPVNREPVSLIELCDTMRDTFAGVCAERHLTLETNLASDVDVIETDRKLITAIVRNLIDNATKFAYEHTSVMLSIDRVATGVRLRVCDKGVGIPLGHQQRIFERFYQVDPSRAGFAARRGTGLGLAIVKHAVKALGGTIGVESVWKHGTTMTVELPASRNAAQ